MCQSGSGRADSFVPNPLNEMAKGEEDSVSTAQDERNCGIIALMRDIGKENIKVISSVNKRQVLVFSFAFILSAVASAKEFVVPPMSI